MVEPEDGDLKERTAQAIKPRVLLLKPDAMSLEGREAAAKNRANKHGWSEPSARKPHVRLLQK